MSRTTLILSGACLILACASSAILISRASIQPVTIPRSKNLFLQPEAARVNRRLGNRFKSLGGPESTLSGSLTLQTNKQPVTIVRRQMATGEAVEVFLAGQRLTWSDAAGTELISATEPERLMLQRLVLDSPDQFVLAQLRGAGYQTITRNLRPDNAGEDYSGPLWTLVRVSEPQNTDEAIQKRRWRLYYINEATELIDRVVSEQDGQMIEANIQWAEQNGVPVPSKISWTMNGQTIMQFELAAFSRTN